MPAGHVDHILVGKEVVMKIAIQPQPDQASPRGV